jgi:hypothetical protein
MLSAGSSNAALFRRLPTQYALFAALQVCVKDDNAGAPAAGRTFAGAALPPGPALAVVVASVPPPPRITSAASTTAATAAPPTITTGDGRFAGVEGGIGWIGVAAIPSGVEAPGFDAAETGVSDGAFATPVAHC